jgi:hypothetical protein
MAQLLFPEGVLIDEQLVSNGVHSAGVWDHCSFFKGSGLAFQVHPD